MRACVAVLCVCALVVSCYAASRENYDKEITNTLASGRTYEVFNEQVASQSTKVPLCLFYNGIGETCVDSYEAKGLRRAFEERNMNVLVVSMCSSSRVWPWTCNGDLSNEDVQYTQQVVKDCQNKYNVDTTRVFGAGFSLGGMFMSKIACDNPYLMSAMAITGCAYTCNHVQTPNTNIIAIQGAQDEICHAWVPNSYESFAKQLCGSAGSGNDRVQNCGGKAMEFHYLPGQHMWKESSSLSWANYSADFFAKADALNGHGFSGVQAPGAGGSNFTPVPSPAPSPKPTPNTPSTTPSANNTVDNTPAGLSAGSCDAVNCGDFGMCMDGHCECIHGYTGVLCQSKIPGVEMNFDAQPSAAAQHGVSMATVILGVAMALMLVL